jgi:hypothetical protein
MMRRSQRTRLGKRRRIEEAGEVEVVPEAGGEVASEAVDGDVVVGGVSRLGYWHTRLVDLIQGLCCCAGYNWGTV